MNTLGTSTIECPECRTRYELPLALPENGRKVRCSKCAFVWLAKPEPLTPPREAESDAFDDIVMRAAASEEKPESPAPEAEPPESTAPAPRAGGAEPAAEARAGEAHEARDDAAAQADADMDIEFAAQEFNAATAVEGEEETPDISGGIAAIPGRPPRRRSSAAVAVGWVLLLTAIGGVGYVAVAERERVVALLPGAAPVYQRLGLPVNIRGLEFRGIAYDWSAVAGRQLLEVSGEVVNISDRPREVPAIEFALRDAANTEIYQWTEEMRSPPLKAGEAASFKASLDSPPRGVVNLQVRFAGSQ